jgi:Tol biopolymer transport system component
MGEVYRARDPRLGRDVAIKVLPTAFSADTGRLQRFEQEARAAAALNHPNILAVYDIGTEGGAPFIVSELLEGDTLRDRVNGGPATVRKSIEHALQIARGLAAAHDKGIVHRDLKPENVFVTRDNRVKILDFGLAKLAQEQPAYSSGTQLATMPSPTQPGVVLGTVGYMAPEQVRGLPVDHRADLFALGAILYELLSGRRAFSRDTAPETMTAILNAEPPDLGSTAEAVPPGLVRIVNRCLEKSPSDRFQSASDLGFALEALSTTSSGSTAAAARVPQHRTPAGWIGWAAAALVLAALSPVVYQHLRERPASPGPMRFQIAPIVEYGGPGNFSLSPDGRHLAFVGIGSDGIARLWVRAMDSLEVRPLPGTDSVGPATPPPFWSPDGRFVAWDAGGRLKKLDVSGGLPQTLCDLPSGSVAVGGSWNRSGDIIFGNFGGLLGVRETGGSASPITTLDPSRKEEFHILPTFLPDGRHFVYLRVSPTAPEFSGTYIGTLDDKPDAQSAQRLMPYGIGITYAAAADSGPGRLLFLREGTLMTQPFDAKRLALAGDPVPVAERVGSFRDGGFFSASANDVLVYRNADDSQISWFDRQGAMSGRVSEPGGFRGVALSPDGARAVASRTDPHDAAKADLWLFDLARGTAATRLTAGSGIVEFPVWSRDGKQIVFTFGNSQLRQKLASGEGDEQELLRSPSAGLVRANSWSPDGRFLLYDAAGPNMRSLDLLVRPDNGAKTVPFVQTAFNEQQGRFSPDGRWVAYVSNQSGASDVYVRAFAPDFSAASAGTGGSVLVSRGGGTAPRWRGDGREIFYLAADGKMMAVDVAAAPEFQAGTPKPLFQTPAGAIVGDVSADGKRFLLVSPAGPSASAPFTVVLNWSAGLKK